ncbi:MAG TPA: hypothetical protein PKE29_01565 [Phycisphaerales bacterium]|nr:hypothetical protein [Phycisphaerales bacterium]
MAMLDLRWFTNEESLRSITPRYLFRLLSPHAVYLRSRGFTIPGLGIGELLDYDALRGILLHPDRATPPRLIDALYFVNELATPDAMDDLLGELEARGLCIDDDQEHAPIDVAIQVWLLDPDMLQEKHAEQYLARPRSFQYFQTERPTIPEFVLPTAEARRALEESLDAWFVDHKRGTGARIFVYPREDRILFLVRHGDPYRREGSMENGEPGSVAYRPLKFDVLEYNPRIGEIGINAGTDGEKLLYRHAVGRHFFNDENFFPGTAKYSLEPLQCDGEASLVCSDVDGIEWVRLKEVHFYWGGAEGEVEVRKAKGVFAAYAKRNATFPRARIIKAVFEVKFTDCKTPRSVCIRPSNVAQYTRDHDSVHIEEWLNRRGFIIQREVPTNAESVLACT